MTTHITALLFILSVSLHSLAAEMPATDQLPITSDVLETPPLPTTRLNRQMSTVYGLVTYSPIDLLIPSKLGVTLGYIRSPDSTWELEYVRGSVSAPFFFSDIGSITDQRISLLKRSYMGTNSFYLSFGASYMDFSAKLGSEYVSTATNGSIPEIDILQMRNLGVQFSVGNQWSFHKNFVVGIDWIGIYQPVFQLDRKDVFVDNTTDPALREDVKDIINALSWIPRLTFLKLQIGATF